MSMLDPRRLRLLVELADRATITAVADELHFTPSTVSHGLSTLEREVGVPLLERSPRSVRLTPAGQALAREGRAILTRLRAAEAEARAIGRLDRGSLALATFPSAGAALVAHAVGLLRARHPAVELRLLDAEPAESLEHVASGEADVAVVYEYPHLPALDRTGLVTVDLVDDPIQVCLPPSHPEGGHSRVDLERLRDDRFVAGRPGSACHAFARALCAHAGFEPEIAFETDDIAFTSALVNAGVGVAVMPQLLVGTAARPMVARELAPAVPPRRISAVSRSSARRLASIEAAVGALVNAAAAGAGGCGSLDALGRLGTDVRRG
jgi:DNA-binding transcriptional LysR family regulator